MIDTQTLLLEISHAFPPITKPEGTSISFHPTGCFECDSLREDLEQYSEPMLTDEAIRFLYCELSCLSTKGLQWVLPSYLRRCVTQEPTYDALETEFLIYNLAPRPEHQDEARQRFQNLSTIQLSCLLHFLNWCEEHLHWSDYCKDEIKTGIDFVESLITNKKTK